MYFSGVIPTIKIRNLKPIKKALKLRAFFDVYLVVALFVDETLYFLAEPFVTYALTLK